MPTTDFLGHSRSAASLDLGAYGIPLKKQVNREEVAPQHQISPRRIPVVSESLIITVITVPPTATSRVRAL